MLAQLVISKEDFWVCCSMQTYALEVVSPLMGMDIQDNDSLRVELAENVSLPGSMALKAVVARHVTRDQSKEVVSQLFV